MKYEVLVDESIKFAKQVLCTFRMSNLMQIHPVVWEMKYKRRTVHCAFIWCNECTWLR